MKARITQRVVVSLSAPQSGRLMVYDTQLTGFGLRVSPAGRKAWFIEYGPARRRRRMTLGTYPALTVAQARSMALERLGQVAQGEDPLEARQARARVPTFNEWQVEYMAEVARRKKHPRHDRAYLGQAAAVWGSKRLDEIDRRAVQAQMQVVAERGHVTANRWLASVRACFGSAVKAGVLDRNPAAGVQGFTQAAPRARVLSDAEFARVIDAVSRLQDPYVRAAFVLLVSTGARKSEVLRTRWEDLDVVGGLWRIPSPKSGRPQVIPLPAVAMAMLRELEPTSDWLVPGRDPSKPRADLRRPWDRIRLEAEIPDVRIHDLRRTFGLHVSQTAGLHLASKLLRHSDIRVTQQVYSPLSVDAMRKALADVGDARGKVIELAKRAVGRSGNQQ